MGYSDEWQLAFNGVSVTTTQRSGVGQLATRCRSRKNAHAAISNCWTKIWLVSSSPFAARIEQIVMGVVRDSRWVADRGRNEVSQLADDCFSVGGPVNADTTRALLRFGELTVDRHRYVAELAGVCLKLTRLEFDLLEKLASNAGRVVSYRSLAEQVFQIRFAPESTALRVHLTHIRRKLGNASVSIVTVRGRGLLFDPEAL